MRPRRFWTWRPRRLWPWRSRRLWSWRPRRFWPWRPRRFWPWRPRDFGPGGPGDFGPWRSWWSRCLWNSRCSRWPWRFSRWPSYCWLSSVIEFNWNVLPPGLFTTGYCPTTRRLYSCGCRRICTNCTCYYCASSWFGFFGGTDDGGFHSGSGSPGRF